MLRSRAGLMLALCWLLAAADALAQPPAFQLRRPRARRAELRFELQRNLIVLPVRLNGRGPYFFILDTGVGKSIITDAGLRDSLNLRLGQQYLVAGVGEEAPLVAFQTDSVQVELGEKTAATARHLSLLLLSDDILDLSGYVGRPIHGILGADVFRSFAVEVEAEKQILTLHRPEQYRPPRGSSWVEMPLEIEGDRAYINTDVALNDSVAMPMRLILDTGAGHALSLETGSDRRLAVPTQRLRAYLGRGLNGDVSGYLGRVKALQLGRYRIKSLVASFPDEAAVRARVGVARNGNIGFELLKRFSVVIDYPHNRLWLRPNALFRDPFEHDMCGLEILAGGPQYRRYIIQRVEPGSPAAIANLLPKDELISINLQPVANMSLTQVTRLLHSADGRRLIMFVRRPDGDLFVTNMTLRRQL
ncbi:aspartyl protease family protein [Hymenobacter edaphi]|uniref:aspartyl protease family protein n=1 Tax=Hymenobacter edaphi TaxID=2211146 RepID=UPI001402B28A|nr:aspartyl protease family protein [Hymenobacter edaphi]